MKTEKNASSLPLLDDLLEKGIVLKSGKSYYAYTRVGKTFLGKNAFEVEEALTRSKIEKYITPEDFKARQEAKNASRSENLNRNDLALNSSKFSDFQKQKDNSVQEAFGELAAQLQELRPNDIDGEILDVFVYDPARARYISTKFTEDTFIKNLQVRFAYKSATKKVLNGQNWSAGGGYHVTSKKWANRLIDGKEISIVRTVRDDTPNEDFFTCGDQILTHIEMKHWKDKQQKKLLKANMNLPKVQAAREAKVQDATRKLAKGANIVDAFSEIASENSQDIEQTKSELQHSARFNSNASEQLAKLQEIERLQNEDPEAALIMLSGYQPGIKTNTLSQF